MKTPMAVLLVFAITLWVKMCAGMGLVVHKSAGSEGLILKIIYTSIIDPICSKPLEILYLDKENDYDFLYPIKAEYLFGRIEVMIGEDVMHTIKYEDVESGDISLDLDQYSAVKKNLPPFKLKTHFPVNSGSTIIRKYYEEDAG